MKLAFVLFKYTPYGGLQRDFLKIALECQSRGHTVSVFTMAWEGDLPEGFDLHLLAPGGLTNHRVCKKFADELLVKGLQKSFDLVVGFNKLPGLDVYFASDPCYVAKACAQHGILYRSSARYRVYAELEKAVFKKGGTTQILLLNPREQALFVKHYQTEVERFHMMPPGIKKRQPNPDADLATRNKVRADFEFVSGDKFLLMVGSGFQTKGVDRSIKALAALPKSLREKCRLMVLGRGKAGPMQRLARKLGVDRQVSFLGAVKDLTPFYLAADLLLHPSRTEAAGMVLIEALTHGLPVLVTDICGYAFHIERANAGRVFPSPFSPEPFEKTLAEMLTDDLVLQWSKNGLDYSRRTDLYSLPQKAASLFERIHTDQSGLCLNYQIR